MKYPHVEYSRVYLVEAIADVAAPTVAELNLGTDVTCDLTKDGLRIRRTTSAANRAMWASTLDGEDPARYRVTVELEGYRFTPPDTEALWEATAAFRDDTYLVVRRGIPYATAWTAGQSVEVIAGRWGKRTTEPSRDNRNVVFSVPLLVTVDEDEATVAA